MTLLGRTEALVARGATWLSYGAAALIVYILAHSVLEILLRYFFQTSTFILEEFVGYALGGMIFLALAASHQEGRLIRVQFLRGSVAPLWQALLDLLATALALFVAGMLLYALLHVFTRNFRFGVTSPSFAETPLWIPQSVMVIGLAYFCLRLVVSLLALAESLFTKRTMAKIRESS